MAEATAQPTRVDLLLAGATVVTMDAERRVYDSGFVAITGDAITAVGPAAEQARYLAASTRNLSGRVVLPGMVNGHTHLTNGIHRGLYDEMPLAEWIPAAMWPVVRSCTRERCYAGARVSIAENLLNGVTTVVAGEFSTPAHDAMDGVLDAVAEAGIRAVVSRVSVDSDESDEPSQATDEDVRESVDGALAEVSRLRAAYDSALVEVVPEPLGVLRCTPDMVREMTAYARAEGTRMTMHVASSPDEIVECERRYDCGPVEFLAKLDALGEHLLIAHCVIATPAEMDLLAQHSTGVSHNPVSNLMYAVGTAQLDELLRAGVPVGLGTDGSSTNNGQNMWEAMKMAMFLQKARFGATWGSAELALELATLGGANAIGMADRIGSLEPGKQADLMVVDLDVPQHAPRATWPSNIVYSNEHTAVRTVMVAGEVLVDDGVLLGWDLPQVCAAADRAAEEVEAATGLYSRYRNRTRWTWIHG